MGDLLQLYLLASSLNKKISSYEATNKHQAEINAELLIDKFESSTDIIADKRRQICEAILALSKKENDLLSQIEELHIASGRLRGMMFDRALDDHEKLAVGAQRNIFLENWSHPKAFSAFTIMSLYYQPFELPLQKNILLLNAEERTRYLYFVMRQPHIMQKTDEEKYIDYYLELTDWLYEIIAHSDHAPELNQSGLLNLISKMLTFGTCYYLDCSTASVVRARAKIVEAVTKRLQGFSELKAFPKFSPPVAGRRKLRLGILSRNAGAYTDTRALYAMFHDFDPNKYEIYLYSLDIIDPTTGSDIHFFRELYSFLHKAISLRGEAIQWAKQILADDLDILIVGTAYSFGVQKMDQMLSSRLARVQIQMNAMVPGSSGLSSYDYMIVPEADADAMVNYRAECTEKIKVLNAPLIWYKKQTRTEPDDKITRQKLGIPKEAIVYCSGAAANKQMPGTIAAWFEILQQVPNSYLLLYPFNPAWGGYFIGLTFLARLQFIMKQYPDINPNRVVVIREVTPDEGNRLIILSDIYLGSFPHGGSTSATLAMLHGKPVVARKSWWLRSTSDPSLVKSIGLQELIGQNTEDMIAIATKLGLDRTYYKHICRHIADRIETAPFFDIATNSKKLQTVIEEIALESGLFEANSDSSCATIEQAS